MTINDSTNNATVVALISSPPKIQRPRASNAIQERFLRLRMR
jgi:hypothetical protein